MRSNVDRGLDQAGFIRPEVSLERIPPRYRPVVDDLREGCRDVFAGELHSLYLNGSVVKGTARPGVSDLDALAVLHGVPSSDHEALAGAVTREIEQRYPFVTGATLLLAQRDFILSRAQRYDMGFFVACLCVCADGEDLATHLPRYRPSVALARGTNGNIRRLLDDRRARVAAASEPATVTFICKGIMRKIVRTGFTLVMPRFRGWTSELEPSAAIFATYYPEQAEAMRAALGLAQTPTADRELVLSVLDSFGIWLADEYDRVIFGRS